jgi:methyl-accepting chemotaxis protein
MKLSNLPIGTRLGAGFALVLLMLIGVAYLGIHGMQQSNQSLHHVVTVNIKKMDALEDMSRSIHIVSRVVRSIALLSDEAQAKLEHKKIDEARAHYDEAFSRLEKMPLDDHGKKFVASIKEDQIAARALVNKFEEMIHTNKEEAVQFLLKEANPATAKWQDAIRDFTNLQEEKIRVTKRLRHTHINQHYF